MRFNPWHIIVPLVVAALVFAVVGLHAAAPASCDDANEARYESQLTSAQKQYAAILADEPTSDCAQDGLDALGRKLCRRADRLVKDVPAVAPVQRSVPSPAEAREQAKGIYKAVLKIEPGGSQADCALSGLAGLKSEEQEQTEEPKEQAG